MIDLIILTGWGEMEEIVTFPCIEVIIDHHLNRGFC
jgi:hypothetical protein